MLPGARHLTKMSEVGHVGPAATWSMYASSKGHHGLGHCCQTSQFLDLWARNIWLQMPFTASLVAPLVKKLPAMQETWVWSLGWEDPLEKEMTTHSSILAWRIRGQRSLGGYSPGGCKSWTWLSDYTTTTKNCINIVVLTGAICQIFLEVAVPGNKMDVPLKLGTVMWLTVANEISHDCRVETVKASTASPPDSSHCLSYNGSTWVLRTRPQFLSYYNKPAKEPPLTPPQAETQWTC